MISGEKLASLCQWFKRKSLVICYGIAPVILLSALLLTCNFGCNVIVNGEIIGTAPSKEYVYNLIDSINEELAFYLDGSDAITVEPTMTPKLVIGKGFSTSHDLGEALKSYCPYLEKAYSVKSNGKTVVAFETKKERQNCYEAFISDMTKDAASYEILDAITFEYELVPYGLIKSGKSAQIMLQRTYDFNDTVELNKDLSLEDILTAYAMSEEDFKKQNPKYKEGKSEKVKINSQIPYIRVICKQSYTENKIIKHTIKYETDDAIFEGQTEIKTEGKDGLEKTEKTKYVLNGTTIYEKEGKTTKTSVTTEVLLVGTKPSPKGTGQISKPCSGTLSSRYGSRSGRLHKGIDISGAEGSPIIAADGGKVVYSGWDDSGYGYMIKIDHGNGYMTMYAHCSKLYVAYGDIVKKGDTIAALGNTGRSTGAHLHFEVINTQTQGTVDPLLFFSV